MSRPPWCRINRVTCPCASLTKVICASTTLRKNSVSDQDACLSLAASRRRICYIHPANPLDQGAIKMKLLMKLLVTFVMLTGGAMAQDLPSRWDELTASDWPKALEKSASTCILPIGILEKHGPHAPMGSDLIQVRESAARVTKSEYAVVFPDYFYGQIYEARHQPGTFALPSKLVWEMLDATCEEIARNGFKKILIVNGHGGNPNFLRFFIQSQLERRREYAVFLHEPAPDPAFTETVNKMRKSDPATDQHAGERET